MPRNKVKAAIVESPLAEKSLQQIAHCLGFLVLQAASLSDKKQNDLIPILASFGFERISIASLLQTTPSTVSVRLYDDERGGVSPQPSPGFFGRAELFRACLKSDDESRQY